MKRYCFTVGGIVCVLGIIGIVMYTHPVHHVSVAAPVQKNLPTKTLEAIPFTIEDRFIGTVQAVHSVDIVSYLSGYLREVLVQPGTKVSQGQALFVLDQRIPLANLNQSKEAVLQAEADRANAETYFKRMQNTETAAISSAELEQANTTFQSADALYQKALAAQNQAQTLYDYTTLTAPVDGWVGNITATAGEYLSPEGKTLATVIGFSPVRIEFGVPMSAPRSLEDFSGATLRLGLSNRDSIDITDFQIRQDNRVDLATDTLSFFIDVPNSAQNLVPGAYVEVRFLYPKEGILIEKNHVTLTPDGATVFVIENNVIQKKNVEIGAPFGNRYWIKSGLSVGEELITAPVSAQQVGQPIHEVSP